MRRGGRRLSGAVVTKRENGARRGGWRAGIAAVLTIAACAGPAVKPPPPGENTAQQAREATEGKRWDEAASRWAELFQRNGPESREACSEAALALMEVPDLASAEEIVREGLGRWPRDIELLELHGDLLHLLGFRRAAEKKYMDALELDPSRAELLLALARVRMELGLELAARESLDRLIELGAETPETWYMLGEASASAGDFARAYEAYAKAFEGGTFPAVDYLRAASTYRDPRVRKKLPGAGDAARAWLERAVALDPQNPLAQQTLGMIAEDRNDLDAAIRHYRRAVEIAPNSVAALASLAALYARRGERAEAQEMANRALELEKNPRRRAEIQRSLDPPPEDE